MSDNISAAIRQINTASAKITSKNSKKGVAQGDGGFLDIIAQMVSSSEISGGIQGINQDLLAQLQQMFGESADGDKEDIIEQLIAQLKKQPTNEAVATIMEMFAQVPTLMQDFAKFSQGNANIIENVSLNQQSNSNIEKLTPKDAEKVIQFLQNLEQSQKENVENLLNKINGQVVKNSYNDTPKEHFTFANAIHDAKKMVSQSTKQNENIQPLVLSEDNVKVLNISDMQGISRANVEPVQSSQIDTYDVIGQLKESFASNIDKSHFVVKLKPEGLGEITVKLVSEGGKIALMVETSNSMVQKALEGNLEQLQTSLKPLNAHVDSVTSNNNSHFQSFDMQQQQGQHNRHAQQNTQHQNIDNNVLDYGNIEEEQEKPQINQSDLNVYI